PWPVYGMRCPDNIGLVETGGKTYVVTANEGDHRDLSGFSEVVRAGTLAVEPPLLASDLSDDRLGRLQVTTTLGDADHNGLYEALYAFGARSVSVFDAAVAGVPVFDGGDDIEQVTAAAVPQGFNCDNVSNSSFDSRSDNSGPTPEGLVIGQACGRT